MTEFFSHVPYETISTQVLVIGAGAAGIRAALSAAQAGAEVLMLSRGGPTESGSSFSSISGGWGIQALVGDERTEVNLDLFYNDIIRAGLGMCDPTLVRILVEESGRRLEDLLSYGLLLRKNQEGQYLRVKGCFSEYERAFLTENMSNIRKTFQAMLRSSGAKILTGTAVALIVHEGACRGAWVVNPDQRMSRVLAGATILATGGGSGLFQDAMGDDPQTGEGYVLAHQAGAELKNIEFIQFMLGIKENGVSRFLPLSHLTDPGTLLDSNGHDILNEWFPRDADRELAVGARTKHHPFSTRDSSRLIDIALARIRNAGEKVLLRSASSGDRKPEVIHLAHAFNGGARIDHNGETTLPALFAAGEVAAGPHGADRIGGCMMTATQVFGARAGRAAALRARERNAEPAGPSVIPGRRLKSPLQSQSGLPALASVRAIFSRESMVLRNGTGLEECLRKIREAQTLLTSMEDVSILPRLKGESILTAMELVTMASLQRKESLGSHYRTDTSSVPESLADRGRP